MRSVFNDAYAILSDFLYKNICYVYLFELPRLVAEYLKHIGN